jgi:hypothetical protein
VAGGGALLYRRLSGSGDAPEVQGGADREQLHPRAPARERLGLDPAKEIRQAEPQPRITRPEP